LSPPVGISTHLFHAERLDREHLVEVAAHGFDAVEVYATRTHFDYHDPRAAVALAEWLDDTRLGLNSVHAPTTTGFVQGRWGETLSIAATDETRRRLAVAETIAALRLAAVVPFRSLVVHLGVPTNDPAGNSRGAAGRSLEAIGEVAQAVGVTVAIELIPNPLSLPTRLVQWIEDDLASPGVGVCLDVGHANLTGDAMEAIEICSGHIVTTHLHDNRGTRDDHLVPGEGGIDWEGVLMAFQKIGYEGAWIFELAPSTEPAAVLARAARARETFERLLRFEQ
jgi:sugar phosphate isomerase/epimerase